MNQLKIFVFLLTTCLFLIILGELVAGHIGLYIGAILAIITVAIALCSTKEGMLNLYKAKKIDPTTHPDLFALMQAAATEAKTDRPSLYLIKEKSCNIFTVGASPKKSAIAITEGFLTLPNDSQSALLSQSLAMIKLRNSFLNCIVAAVAGTISGIANVSWDTVFEDDAQQKSYFNPNIMKVVGPIAACIIKSIISPTMYLQADALSVQWTKRPEQLIAALNALSEQKEKNAVKIANMKPATAHLFIINPLDNQKVEKMFEVHPVLSYRLSLLSSEK